MNLGPEGRQFRLLTVHCVLWSLAMSLANGFLLTRQPQPT
jgi:hypothetical protein